jgi:CheY-like chemotaxis protein
MDRKDHILIVDDDRDLRELLVQYLEKNEFTVSAAKSGREMRQTLADKTIDLIVLDLMMPHEDGLKLCRDLRAADAASPPILMLTARGDELRASCWRGSRPSSVAPERCRPTSNCPKPHVGWPSATGCSTPRNGIWWIPPARWSRLAAPNIGYCALSSTILNGCSTATSS